MALIATETWTGTDGVAWPGQWNVIAGTADILGNRGRMVTPASGFSRANRAQIPGMASAADVELVVEFTLEAGAPEAYLAFALRTDGTYPSGAAYVANGYFAQMRLDASGYLRLKKGDGAAGAAGTQLVQINKTDWVGGATYVLRFRNEGSTISGRVWDKSTAEPSTWTATATDTTWTAAGKFAVDFGSGAAATARTILLDNLTINSLGVSTPTPTVTSVWVGAPTTGGATVAAKVTDTTSARLKVATNLGLTTGVVFGSAATPDAQGLVKLPVTGLTADTQYYYAVEVDGTVDTGKTGSFRTLPAGQASFSFAFGSCSDTANSPTFSAIHTRNPDFFIHLGDLHYANITANDPALFRTQYDTILATANQGGLYANVPTVYTWSDHDSGPDNHDAAQAAMPAAQAAYRQYVPHFPLAAGDGVGIYHTFAVGRVRFIVTDERSYRSADAATDNSSKTMLGAVQKQWFKDTVTAATEPVLIWCNEVPWIGTLGTNGGDDWGSGFTTERDELATFITASGKHVAILEGDMHALAADDGTNSPGGIPVFHAAPLDQTAFVFGGPFSQGTFPASTGGTSIQQYGWMDVTDSGSSIALAFTGYDAAGTSHITLTKTFAVAGGGGGAYDPGWHVYSRAASDWVPVAVEVL